VFVAARFVSRKSESTEEEEPETMKCDEVGRRHE